MTLVIRAVWAHEPTSDGLLRKMAFCGIERPTGRRARRRHRRGARRRRRHGRRRGRRRGERVHAGVGAFVPRVHRLGPPVVPCRVGQIVGRHEARVVRAFLEQHGDDLVGQRLVGRDLEQVLDRSRRPRPCSIGEHERRPACGELRVIGRLDQAGRLNHDGCVDPEAERRRVLARVCAVVRLDPPEVAALGGERLWQLQRGVAVGTGLDPLLREHDLREVRVRADLEDVLQRTDAARARVLDHEGDRLLVDRDLRGSFRDQRFRRIDRHAGDRSGDRRTQGVRALGAFAPDQDEDREHGHEIASENTGHLPRCIGRDRIRD